MSKRGKKYIHTTKLVKQRMYIVLLVFAVILVTLIFRTGYWQIIKGNELSKQAIAQQTRDKIIDSKRGAILDRNNKPLAISAKVEKDAADKVRDYVNKFKISGVHLDEDVKRFYPYGNFASQIIGFCGTDNQGLEGIEGMYDSVLKGSPGRVVSAANGSGTAMPFKYEKMVDAKNGLNVVLTIDETIQRIAEKYLEQAVVENKLGNGAACIVMDVASGDILAMATKPDYDLNEPFVLRDESAIAAVEAASEDKKLEVKQQYLAKMWRNKAVQDSYEPGSCFKIFTAAMALEEGVVSDSDVFVCNGSKKVDKYDIRCWRTIGHGTQNFSQAVQNSCNPAFIEIGSRVGTTKFMQYLRGFGFYDKTGISLAGEAIGLFHDPKNFNEVELATSSFGQGFTVTPLQMVTGVAAIVNDGKMMRPKIVKRYTDENGNIVSEMPNEMIRQIVSEDTSTKLRSILESVVSEGGGSGAYITGYRVGGKTGTSEKLPRGSGKYIASFMGVAPCDAPQIVCLVLLDEPNGDTYYGGVIAAPVARSIMEETLQYLNVEPAYTQEELATLETVVPNLTGLTIAQASEEVAKTGLKFKTYGNEETIKSQLPKAGVKVNKNSIIIGYATDSRENTTTAVPIVTGMTVSQAIAAVTQNNLNISVVGTGSTTNSNAIISYKQDPLPGTIVEFGSTVVVEFKRIEAGE